MTTQTYKVKNFLPIYIRAMEIVEEKGFFHVEFSTVRMAQSNRFRFYRLKSALINDPNAPEKLKAMAPYFSILWKKDSKTLELLDLRKQKDVGDLGGWVEKVESGTTVKEFDSELDILDYPEFPEG